MTSKIHLGDGAYVQIGAWHGEVVLTTEDGICAQNVVHLGEAEVEMLMKWLSRHSPTARAFIEEIVISTARKARDGN